jgi:hypothetical protein
MKLRFTIRDLLWLTALIAMGIGWWLDRHSSALWRSAKTPQGTWIANEKTGEAVLLQPNGDIGYFPLPGDGRWSKPKK